MSVKKGQQTFLTDRFFFVTGLVLFVAVAALVLPALTPFALILWPVLALATFSDRKSLIPPGVFTAEIILPRIPEIGEKVPFEVRLNLHSQKALRLPEIHLLLPNIQTIAFQKVSWPFRRESKDDQSWLAVNTEGLARRLGYERPSEIKILAYSFGRLWFRTLTLPVENPGFRVIPSRKTPREQAFRELSHSQRLLFQGNRRKMRSHSSDQFHSIREYHYPDSIRHIDAKKTARFQKLMTRTFDTFYDHHLILGLDIGRSLSGTIAGSEKHDFYLAACLALAENANRSRDRISFFAFSQKVHYSIRNARSMSQFQALFEGRHVLRPRDEESNYELILPAVQRLSGQRSILVLLTDTMKPSVQEALRGPLASLCNRHLTVAVSVLDEALSLEPSLQKIVASPKMDASQYSRLLYSYWLNERALQFQTEVGSRGGGAVVVSHKSWMTVIVHLYELLRSSVSI